MTNEEKIGAIERSMRRVMSKDKFVMFMNILRILTFFIIILIAVYLIKEIEHVKMLGDACSVCSNKTEYTCISPVKP